MAKMTVPSAAQMQESLKFMAAAAAQSGGLVADPFTLALMASASGAADPFMNLPGASPFHLAAQAAAEAKASEGEGSSAAMAASDKELESLVN